MDNQEGLTREEVINELRQTAEAIFDPEAVKGQTHRWIDRGAVLSCEGGDHPPHRAFKRR